MRPTPISSALLILLCAAASPAQQPAAGGTPQAEFKTTTEEVVLDVVVRDKKGKPIKDLTAADIQVKDDGVSQKITGFRLVEGREAIENGSKVPLDAMRQIRLVTLVFERLGDSARLIAKKAAEDLIKGDQAQNVFYSVIAIDTQLYVLQEFTTDKEALKKAITKATSGKYSTFAAESDRIKASLRETSGKAGSPQGSVTTPTTPNGQNEIERRTSEIMLNMLQFDSSYGRDEGTRMSIFALLSLVRGQYSMPGRKSIIYFSEGMYIPTHLDEPFRNISSTANRGNVSFYAVDTRGVMTWNQNAGAADDLKEAAKDTAADTTATEGRVSKSQIMAGDRAESAGRSNTQLPLRTLAESTGGFLIGESNDLRGPLRQVNEDVSSYYEVTYNPGIANYDGKFRKTDVELARKDVVVHHRTGYFALPISLRGPAVMPYEMALLKALDTKPMPKDLEFRSGAFRVRPGKDTTKSLVIVEVPMKNLTFTEVAADKTYKARLALVALIKDDKGEVVSKLTRDLPLKGPMEQVPQVKAGNFIYKEAVQLAPGRYTLESAVIDYEGNKIGTRKSALVVLPQTKGVAMSNLCLVRNFQQNAKIDPEEPLQYQGGLITPTLSGQVFAVKGAQLSTFFIVYPDPTIADKPTGEIEFLVDGNVIAKGALPLPTADAQGRVPYVMSSPAENMPAATYEIHVTVRQGTTVAEDRTQVVVAAAGQ
jgi:VWFA-related protein